MSSLMNKTVVMYVKDTLHCDYACKIVETAVGCDKLKVFKGTVNDSFPEDSYSFMPDFIISFVSPWIIPEDMLKRAKKLALNFHPGSPKYPGIGCYNFALYDQVDRYGVTCHEMKARVDTGNIISTSMFDILPYDNVESLKLKSMNHLLLLLEKLMADIVSGNEIHPNGETWKRKPYTRRELNELCVVDELVMGSDEIQRRIKALDYLPEFGAYKIVDGKKIFYPIKTKKPLV
jgi:methionyl-tRNA formyltransferase